MGDGYRAHGSKHESWKRVLEAGGSLLERRVNNFTSAKNKERARRRRRREEEEEEEEEGEEEEEDDDDDDGRELEARNAFERFFAILEISLSGYDEVPAPQTHQHAPSASSLAPTNPPPPPTTQHPPSVLHPTLVENASLIPIPAEILNSSISSSSSSSSSSSFVITR
ncbi:histone H3.v1-like [Macrobrachium nipponense]|uniref:histone H3.v1-like n=1 Tax=Macrobrachium nipponense TaxID=159736 RepID=UPI0030C845A8